MKLIDFFSLISYSIILGMHYVKKIKININDIKDFIFLKK
jgi:hypothetical protein